MELPIRARYLIRELSRPMTRPDWRTCKCTESTLIKNYKDELWDDFCMNRHPNRHLNKPLYNFYRLKSCRYIADWSGW